MIIDISLALSNNLPVWPGDPSIQLKQVQFIEKGESSNVSHLITSVHAGTHVDAPQHFLTGKKTVDQLDLSTLIGKALVVSFPDSVSCISDVELESKNIPEGTVRLLIKTKNSKHWQHKKIDFWSDFVGISETGARWIVEHNIRLVGIDYLSIAPFNQSIPTHQVLLGAEVIVIEGLDLSSADEGLYELVCLPLKLKGSDGAPARVILRK